MTLFGGREKIVIASLGRLTSKSGWADEQFESCPKPVYGISYNPFCLNGTQRHGSLWRPINRPIHPLRYSPNTIPNISPQSLLRPPILLTVIQSISTHDMSLPVINCPPTHLNGEAPLLDLPVPNAKSMLRATAFQRAQVPENLKKLTAWINITPFNDLPDYRPSLHFFDSCEPVPDAIFEGHCQSQNKIFIRPSTPGYGLLHQLEINICYHTRLDPKKYLNAKKRIFAAYAYRAAYGFNMQNTDCQKVSNIDGNKAAILFHTYKHCGLFSMEPRLIPATDANSLEIVLFRDGAVAQQRRAIAKEQRRKSSFERGSSVKGSPRKPRPEKSINSPRKSGTALGKPWAPYTVPSRSALSSSDFSRSSSYLPQRRISIEMLLNAVNVIEHGSSSQDASEKHCAVSVTPSSNSSPSRAPIPASFTVQEKESAHVLLHIGSQTFVKC